MPVLHFEQYEKTLPGFTANPAKILKLLNDTKQIHTLITLFCLLYLFFTRNAIAFPFCLFWQEGVSLVEGRKRKDTKIRGNMLYSSGKEGYTMNGVNDFFSTNDNSALGYLPLLQPFDLDEDRQSYFLSLPENEQLEILKESRGSEEILRKRIEDRRLCD